MKYQDIIESYEVECICDLDWAGMDLSGYTHEDLRGLMRVGLDLECHDLLRAVNRELLDRHQADALANEKAKRDAHKPLYMFDCPVELAKANQR